MIVKEIMTSDPYAIKVTESVEQVLRKLSEADVRHLPVVEAGTLVGIVSDRDVRGVVPSPLEALDDPEAAQKALSRPVSQIMSHDVLSTNPEADVAEVIDLMLENRVGAIPVVEPDSGKLIGIVSYVDVLRAARDLL